MKTILLILGFLLLEGVACRAQITSVLIGVNGLTCSQCTRNVEMQLRRLPFVAEVSMNLEHTNGVIKLRAGASPMPEAIAKSVENAGFSLRYLKITVQQPAQYRVGDSCFTIAGLSFQAVASAEKALLSTVSMQLLGEPFPPKKYAQQKFKKTCAAGGKVYFVKIDND